MKILKAEIIVPACYVEWEIEDEEELSKEDIEDMLYERLTEDLSALDIEFIYDIEEE